jgi:Na+/proline symporter
MGLSTLLLLLGVQSLYQKFYSARNPSEAKRAAGIWVIGTLFIEAVAVIIAIFATVHFWDRLQAGQIDHAEVIVRAAREMIPMPVGVLLLGAATVVVISTGMNYLLSPTTTLIRDILQRFFGKGDTKAKNKEKAAQNLSPARLLTSPQILASLVLILAFFLPWFKSPAFSFTGVQIQEFLHFSDIFARDAGVTGFLFKACVYLTPIFALFVIVLAFLRKSTAIAGLVGSLLPFGALGIVLVNSNEILGQMGIGVYMTMIAALALILYRNPVKIDADKKVVFLQKFLIVLVGVTAYLLATQMRSVMENALFAYTIYGVAITPALLAALAWKRTTKVAGLISIISATLITVSLKIAGYIWPSIMIPHGDPNADPFGVPILYPAVAVALISLIGVSLITKRPSKEVLSRFFPDEK